MLTLLYSRIARRLGRLGGMVKQVPEWFSSRSIALAMGILSLSFVFGGVLATILAGFIASWSGNNWRWVMSGPSIVVVSSWRSAGSLSLEAGATERKPSIARAKPARDGEASRCRRTVRRFWIACALSFMLTLLRETFNTWTVDFFKTAGLTMSSDIAAFLSTPFDAFGATGIVTLGWFSGESGSGRRCRCCSMLCAARRAIVVLLSLAARNVVLATAGVGGIGFSRLRSIQSAGRRVRRGDRAKNTSRPWPGSSTE